MTTGTATSNQKRVEYILSGTRTSQLRMPVAAAAVACVWAFFILEAGLHHSAARMPGKWLCGAPQRAARLPDDWGVGSGCL